MLPKIVCAAFGGGRAMRNRRCSVFANKVFLMICWSWILSHIPCGQKNCRDSNLYERQERDSFDFSFFFLKDLSMSPEKWFIRSDISPFCSCCWPCGIFSPSCSFAFHVFKFFPITQTLLFSLPSISLWGSLWLFQFTLIIVFL